MAEPPYASPDLSTLAARVAALEARRVRRAETLTPRFTSIFEGLVGLPNAVFLPKPSGDTSGATDTAAIQSLIANSVILLAWPGVYYITSVLWQNLANVGIIGAGKNITIFEIAGNNHIGFNFLGTTGTGDISNIYLAHFTVRSGGVGNTAIQLWNADDVSGDHCEFSSDWLAMSYQGSFNASFRDSDLFIQGTNATPLTCLWTGSGKASPYVGAVTLSGAGALEWIGGRIESFHLAPAMLLDENTYTIKFSTVQFTAEGGTWASMIQCDGDALEAVFDNCYQEAAHNNGLSGSDFGIGLNLGKCGQVSVTNYSSTGSAGQEYFMDINWCERLYVRNVEAIAYSAANVNFRSLPRGADNRHYIFENIDNGSNFAKPIYNAADVTIPTTYRGDLHRTNRWETVHQAGSALLAGNVLLAGTYLISFSNPTPARVPSDNLSATEYFWYDTTDYECAPVRVRAVILTNNVAPGVTLNAGIVPSSGAPSGGNTVIQLANGAFIVNSAIAAPGANSSTEITTAAAVITTGAALLGLAVSTAGAFAANSVVACLLELQVLR